MIATIRSLATYVAVTLYILLIGPPVLLVALALGRRALLYRAGHLGVRLGLALSGITADVDNPHYIQRRRAAVYATNHTSNVEPPIVFDALHELFPRLRILYKAELRKLPVLVRAFDLAGFVPLERGNREQSLPAIERAAGDLRDGNSFLIFPEGTRSRTGELLPFKKGGFIMAIKGQAPIVPVAVKGAREAMRKGSPIIQPVRVRVRFGEPVETAGLTMDDRDALMATVRSRVAALLAEM
jgi:1-acyl-sn-glycerol-3-phosphate acyltransferase